MKSTPFAGSPAIPTITNSGKPPATPEDIKKEWDRWSPIDASSSDELTRFANERQLDLAVGNALGFRYRLVSGLGPCLGFHVGGAIKVRSLVAKDGEYRRLMEPVARKLHADELVLIPARAEERGEGGPARTVVICESETDLWAVAQLAPELDVALMPAGARTWKEEWGPRLIGYERVLVATDADDSGDLGASKIALDVPAAIRLRPVSGAKDWCEVVADKLIDQAAFAVLAASVSEPIRSPRISRTRVQGALANLSEDTGLPINARGLIALAGSELKLPQDYVRAVADELAFPAPQIGAWTGTQVIERPEPPVRPEVFGNGQWVEGEILGLAGPAGVGKTLVVLQAGLSLALGLPYFLCDELPIPRPRRVLYIAGEGASFSFSERFRSLSAAALALEGSGELQNFQTLGPVGKAEAAWAGPGGGIGLKLDLASHLQLLLPQIDSIAPEVVILDPIRALHSKNENDSQEMEEFFYLLRDRLVRERGLSLLMTHHLKKGATLDANAARGGSWQENVGTSLLLAPTGRLGDLTLKATKTRNGPPLRDLKIDRDPETLWHTAGVATRNEGDFAAVTEKLFTWFMEQPPTRSTVWHKLMDQVGFKEKKAKAFQKHLGADDRFYLYRDTSSVGHPWRLRLRPGLAG